MKTLYLFSVKTLYLFSVNTPYYFSRFYWHISLVSLPTDRLYTYKRTWTIFFLGGGRWVSCFLIFFLILFLLMKTWYSTRSSAKIYTFHRYNYKNIKSLNQKIFFFYLLLCRFCFLITSIFLFNSENLSFYHFTVKWKI